MGDHFNLRKKFTNMEKQQQTSKAKYEPTTNHLKRIFSIFSFDFATYYYQSNYFF